MSRYVVGLTGGIASGKSEVTRRFEALGIVVADADLAARAVVAAGSPALARIAERFGADMLLADGSLDRGRLRAHVFAAPAERTALEAITHPAIRLLMQQQCEQATSAYAIAAIPLLTEVGGRKAYPWLDRVLLVDAPEAVQHARLMQRDGIDAALADRMIAAQASRAQRLALADDVVVNDGQPEDLQVQVEQLHARYLGLAGGCGRVAGQRPALPKRIHAWIWGSAVEPSPCSAATIKAEHRLSSTKRSASTRGADLVQLQAGVAGEFTGAEQQAVDHIGIELLAGTALLPREFGGVQQLDQGMQTGKRAAEAGHHGCLRRAGPLHVQRLAVGGVAAIHARQQRGQQVLGVIQQNFDTLGDVGRQQVGGVADQGVQLGEQRAVGHGGAPRSRQATCRCKVADGAGWRTGQLPDGWKLRRIPGNPHAPPAMKRARCIVRDAAQGIGSFPSNS
jgi:dephospho-CoA kinase